MGNAELVNITVFGVCPSKKNSRVMNWKKRLSLPSREYMAWIDSAVLQIKVCAGGRQFTTPVSVTATFYRDRRADLDNLVLSLGDSLQKSGLLKNDRQICEWHVRLVSDKTKPRIEVCIQEVT